MKNVLTKWFDNNHQKNLANDQETLNRNSIDWVRIIPFVGIHLACFAVIWVGVSVTAVIVCLISYVIRMFAITAFYHRYFSHKSFKTSRTIQTIFAILGATATQRGPLWWAAHHRHHHRFSDEQADIHSPVKGFLHSHMHWFLKKENFSTKSSDVPDLNQYPELNFIDRFDILFPIIYALLLFGLGWLLSLYFPSLGANHWQLLIWGYFISTVLLSHVTYCINSLAHIFGSRSYATGDNSRNNFILALLTLGEGWHNNHHCSPGSVKQGFHWWQLDISFYLLKGMEKLGLIWDLKYPNKKLLAKKMLVK